MNNLSLLKPGIKVKFLDYNGWPHDQKGAKEAGFRAGMVYTVSRVDIREFSSWLEVEEILGFFNTVMFEQVEVQVEPFTTPRNVIPEVNGVKVTLITDMYVDNKYRVMTRSVRLRAHNIKDAITVIKGTEFIYFANDFHKLVRDDAGELYAIIPIAPNENKLKDWVIATKEHSQILLAHRRLHV